MDSGYIKIWRKLFHSFYYKESEYVHLWIHLLLKASHIRHEFLFNGKRMTCDRGQLITGRKSLSKETGINEHKVDRIIKVLKSEHQIEQQTTNRFSLITILNYNDYQSQNEQQNEQQVSNNCATDEQQLSTYNKQKNEKNDKNDNIYSSKFPEIWDKYPNKQGKSKALLRFEASVKTEVDFENIKKGLENYLLSARVKEGYIQNGSTWFGDWRCWIEPTEQMMQGKSKTGWRNPYAE